MNNALQNLTKEELTRMLNDEVGTQVAPINEYSDFVTRADEAHGHGHRSGPSQREASSRR